MKVKLIFTSPKHPTCISRLISLVQKSKFSHVGMQIDHIIYGQSVVFQAAQTSVQMITLERFLANYYIVNSIELELPEPSFRRVILFLVKNLGNYYSFFGLLGMGIKAITHGRNPFKDGYQTMFCSEYMTAALQQAGLLENLEPEQVGPKEVFEALEAK